VHDFEATYGAYGDFQWRMERYWSLRWLIQEGVRIAEAQVVRDNLVRLEGLPFFTRVHSLPALGPGTRVELEIERIDLLEVELRARFVQVKS